MRRPGTAWLIASALCVGAAMVVIVALKSHWEAREVDWMLGGATALLACAATAQACFQRARRDSPAPHDVEGQLLRKLDDLQGSRRLLEEMAASLEAHRDLLDADGARSLDELHAAMGQRDADAAGRLDAQARILRRNRRLAIALAWTVGVITAIVLLEAGSGAPR